MRSMVCFIFLLIAFPLSANAQDQHHYEIAGGYSHMYILGEGAPGWFVSLSFKKDRWLAVGVDGVRFPKIGLSGYHRLQPHGGSTLT